MTLVEGKHFGEISLLNNLPRMYTAVARSDCELLRLNRKDLLEVMKPYPKIRAHLSGAAHEKLQEMKSRGED
jgi:CRP-like cAMP-binding protein